MFAINHAATSLIIKHQFTSVPIVPILLSVQAVEILWVFLNYKGIEKLHTDKEIKYVGNVHLSHMPYSHSIAGNLFVAIIFFILGYFFSGFTAGLALFAGVISHLILDLITHSPDIALAPGLEKYKFGLGLYSNWPRIAFILELLYGFLCWWIYGGSLFLLAVIIIFNFFNITYFFKAIPGLESKLVNKPKTIVSLIFIQIIITLILVGILS